MPYGNPKYRFLMSKSTSLTKRYYMNSLQSLILFADHITELAPVSDASKNKIHDHRSFIAGDLYL